MAEHVYLLLGKIAVFVDLDTSVSIVKQVGLNDFPLCQTSLYCLHIYNAELP